MTSLLCRQVGIEGVGDTENHHYNTTVVIAAGKIFSG